MLAEAGCHEEANECLICLKHSPSMLSKELLRQVSYTSGTPLEAPKMLQVDLSGHLLQSFPETWGIYGLQSNLINGFPNWKNPVGNTVIWYNKRNDHWCISDSQYLGSDKWIFAGPNQDDRLPHSIDCPWRYQSENGSWEDVNQLVKGKTKSLLQNNQTKNLISIK